jgi:xylulokinase
VSRTPAVLAIDVGTTSTKAGVVGLDGRLLALGRAGYPITVGHRPGWAEQDPEAWWSAAIEASRDALARATDPDIVAIAVDGHGPTLAPVDGEGRPTRPAIAWLDTRSVEELQELSLLSGLRGWALGVLPAALWVERNEPEAAGRSSWYLNTWEFVTFRLSGEARTTEVPGQHLPADVVLAEVGLAAAKIAPRIEAASVIGGLRDDAAVALGLRAGTPVVAGVVDAFASFHGAGLVRPGDAIDTGGTSGGFGVYWSEPVEARGSFCTPAPLPGRYVVGGAMAATGRALDWLREDVLGGSITIERLIADAAGIEPGANGLVFLPYLAGERSPLWDPEARGAFVGLTLAHGRAHLVRAVLEAAALAIRHVAAPILEQGVTLREMRVCGGPARSETWNQIKADVTGFSVGVPHALETAVIGSGMVGAVGVGAHPDIETAVGSMTRVDRHHTPRPELQATYDRVYEAYVELYPALSAALRPLAARPTARELTIEPPAATPSAAVGART